MCACLCDGDQFVCTCERYDIFFSFCAKNKNIAINRGFDD